MFDSNMTSTEDSVTAPDDTYDSVLSDIDQVLGAGTGASQQPGLSGPLSQAAIQGESGPPQSQESPGQTPNQTQK